MAPLVFKWRHLAFFSRGGRIRTYDLHIPNVARYRATLHPENKNPSIFKDGKDIKKEVQS